MSKNDFGLRAKKKNFRLEANLKLKVFAWFENLNAPNS